MRSYTELLQRQRAFFQSGKTKDLDYRLDALNKLLEAIKKNETRLLAALRVDLNKSELDGYMTEIGITLKEIRLVSANLKKWARPKRVKTPISHAGSASYVYSDPYGVALIISPWNYPFQLAVAPLIGAIAAGNCAIIKPSELTPATSDILKEIIEDCFPDEYISVVLGDADTSQALLKEKFDYIFFTGGVAVGQIVMEAAAKHLTPVTLELGGKSPCIVHEDANLKLAAKRIAWGKFTNAGQTCIAPDYLYVHRSIKEAFLQQLKEEIIHFYEEDTLNNPNYTRIISDKHFDRLAAYLDNGQLFAGGKSIREKRLIEPSILTGITWDDPVMKEEIFGPILPVLEYNAIEEALDGINHHPNPLAFYIFTESETIQQQAVKTVPFGGGCINDTVYHVASPHLPFGGIGTSGMGSYHGKGSFDTFTHKKSVLKQTTRFDIPLRYPNVKNGLKKIKLFLK